ncbi:MAG: GtrA family protein [Candidatus Aenigmatarchaeota archaeon]|nr:MAG: GtrA family protein [Candidatus Aenigmarchaeota archaeon]
MRVFKFSSVGLIGLLVNEFMLWFFTDSVGLFYLVSSIIASIISIISNFIINDKWTFRERRSGNIFKRLVKYCSISAVTALIIVSVLYILTDFLGIYYLISNIFGVFVAFYWSYSSNIRWTWPVKLGEIRKLQNKNPNVSVIIPASNKDSVKGFVEGVSSVLEENNIDNDIMVVDDENSSVLKGFSDVRGDVVGVIHPFHSPEAIPELIKPIMNNESDLVIGSRYAEGSELNCSFGERISYRFKSLLARGLTNVKDPLPGFFFFNKNLIKGVYLDSGCYSPGLEVLVRGKYGNAREVPYSINCEQDMSNRSSIFRYFKNLIKLYWYRINE